MLDETLDPAEALGEREQAAALERAARRVQPPAQHRRDDAAEAARHLRPRERVLRVARQPRVVDALDLRLMLEELRDRDHVGAVTLHAQCQSLDGARSEERIERARYTPHRVLQ